MANRAPTKFATKKKLINAWQKCKVWTGFEPGTPGRKANTIATEPKEFSITQLLGIVFKSGNSLLERMVSHNSTYSIYLSTSDLSSFIICNTDKDEFSSIWKWISCSNDVMNHFDCVMKRDVYPQKINSFSKNIRDISFSRSSDIRGISRKN